MNIKIVVSTHKKYQMPTDKMYLPLHAGKEGKDDLGYVGDDTGENISNKNSYYNEMTAVYWAWKNCKSDYIGMVHYRRHFTNSSIINRITAKNKFSLVISSEELEKDLETTEIILPSKRKYYIETIESHYRHLPYTIDSDLDCMRLVINEMYPEYLSSFEKVMKRTWAHMFNMFVMEKNLFDEYAAWAFSVLFEVEKRISLQGRRPIEARMYISEFLIDTWIECKGYSYKELPVMFMEKQNWLVKGGKFILRKVKGNNKAKYI